jgi:hypothetical protein
MTERTEVLRSTVPAAAALLRFDDAAGGWVDRPVLELVEALTARMVCVAEATSVVSSA